MTEITGAPKAPERESDCSRLLCRVKALSTVMDRNLGRLRTSSDILYLPSNREKPNPEKREEGWVGEMEASLDELESLITDFATELEWLTKLTG